MDQIWIVRIGEALDETIFISIEISLQEQEDLKSLLRKYNHVFASQHEQRLRVSPDIVCHKFDINTNTNLVK